jgi:hypothetical protein
VKHPTCLLLVALCVAALCPGGAPRGEAAPARADKDRKWDKDAEAKKTQARLAAEGRKLQAKSGARQRNPFLLTWLTKVHLDDPAMTGTPVLGFEGFFLYGTEAEKNDYRERLEAFLREEYKTHPDLGGKATVDLGKLKAKPAPVFFMQKRVVDAGLDGTLLENVWFDESGTLQFEGLLGDPAHKAELEKVVRANLDRDVLAGEKAWSLARLTPVRLAGADKDGSWAEVLRGLQQQLARGGNPLSTRTRLDRAYFDYDGGVPLLICKGVHLHPGNSAPPNLTRDLGSQLLTACKAVLERPADPAVRADLIQALPSPVLVLQKMAVDQKLDGVLFEQAWYDGDGTLVFGGFLGDPAYQSDLEKGITATLRDGVLPPARLDRPARWSTASLKSFRTAADRKDLTWSAVLKGLQQQLASSPAAVCRQTRLDRAYFDYAEGVPLLLFKGAHLYSGARPTGLARELGSHLLTALKAVVDRPTDPAVRVDAIEALVSPVLELQDLAVAEELDGTLFEHAWYDGQGRLLLSGYRDSGVRPERINELVRKLARKTPILHQGDVGPLDHLKELDWTALRRKLQAAFADKDADLLFRQTRLDRMYFAREEGVKGFRLHVKGICIHHDKDLADAARLQKLRNKFAETLKEDLPDHEPVVSEIVATREPLIPRLYEAVKKAGVGPVFIPKPYYRADGELHLDPIPIVEGKEVVDPREKRERINEVLKNELKDDPVSRPQVKPSARKGPEPGTGA